MTFLDNQSQQNSLFFFGIPRVFGETLEVCEKSTRDIIRHDMNVNETMLIVFSASAASAVFVRFQSYRQKEEVLRQTRGLKATSSPVYIREVLYEPVKACTSGTVDEIHEG